jgi:hypothetical protein
MCHNDANQKDVFQDGEVSLELTNSIGDKYAVDGIAKKITRGGEYYFVPSMDTVTNWGYKD